MSNSTKRSRSWVFTLNNYTEGDVNFLKGLQCNYIVFGKEVAPTTGTPHLQGYIEFATARTMTAIKKKMELSQDMHLEIRKGTPQEAREYCIKEGDVYERGDIPQANGHRKGLEEATKAVIEGKSMDEIANEFPNEYVRYSSGLKSLATVKVKPRDPKNPPQVIWLWGLAGTGKTREAYESHKSVYIKDGTQWWDGYEGQEAIIIDDFEAIEWNYRDFLRLLDRYPYRGQFKGGYVNVNSPTIYITCEYHPSKIWTGNKLAQVTRRLNQIVEKITQGTFTQGDLGNTETVTKNEEEKPVFYKLLNPHKE